MVQRPCKMAKMRSLETFVFAVSVDGRGQTEEGLVGKQELKTAVADRTFKMSRGEAAKAV